MTLKPGKPVTLKAGLGVTKGQRKSIVVIGLSRTVSEINGDFRRKSPFSPRQCFNRPRWRGSPWNWVSLQESEETRMMRLPDAWKCFKIGLTVLIQYRPVFRHPASQPRCRSLYRAYYVARVKWKVKLIFRDVWNSFTTWPDWPWPPNFTTDLRLCTSVDLSCDQAGL